MARIRSIHFNAQCEVAAKSIDILLKRPDVLRSRVHLPQDQRDMEVSPSEQRQADNAAQTWTTETAARSHLQILLENQNSEMLTDITSPERPELIPDMKLEGEQEMPLMGTRSVSFQQTANSLPIFGTRSVVEIDSDTRRLVSVDGIVTQVPDISPIPRLGSMQAAEALSSYLDQALELSDAPTLCYFPKTDGPDLDAGGDTEASWRLAYHFRRVPVEPPATAGEETPHCCGAASPFGPIPHEYLVDANNGEILLFYPSAAFIDVPIMCNGIDVDGNRRDFDGIQLGPSSFQLTDPLRGLETCDARYADISVAGLPAVPPVRHNATGFPATSAAAVTAHFYAALVFDFFNHVLKRNGIDGKGMKLVSVVNCYSSRSNREPPPVWRNAMWSQGRMWYGSLPGGGGSLSTARFLDVMAHELAHGVTGSSAGLIYKNQSGALNESFSDIFGILIKNWYPGEPNALAGWSWILGEEWRGTGTVLRDVQDPTLGGTIWPGGPGQPAHMNQYVSTLQDNGGVHINSGIHNRAFFNLINSADAEGSMIFAPAEIAVLYYTTLTRLAPSSNFSDCRRTLLNVATNRYIGRPTVQSVSIAAISNAYNSVGIL